MGRKNKINKAMGLTAVLIILSGVIYGCYSRDVTDVKNIYGRNVKPRLLSEEEIRKFAGTIRKVDGEAEAHYRMALYFQERRRHKLAIDELKQALKRDPASAKAYNAIGVSFDNLGDYDAAIDYYRQALIIDPGLDYVYNNLGYSCLLKNDVQKAAEAFQQAIALNGNEKRYSNNLGLAYARQGKYESALDQFKSQDSDANAETMLAKVMKDIGKAAEVDAVLLAVRNAPKTEAVAARSSDSTEIPVQSVLPEAAPQSSEVAVAEVKQEVPKEEVIAEVKQEVPKEEVIAEVKQESPKEEMIAEVKPEVPKVVDVKPEKPQVVVAEVKAETPRNPTVDIAPAALPAPQKPEEIRIAAVQPLNVQPESKPVVKEAVKSDPVPVSAVVRPSGSDNPAPDVTKIQVREVKVVESLSSTQAGAGQTVHGKAASKEIEVAVENGNGVKGAAGKVAEHLRRKGFKVVKVSDAKSFYHFSTKVFCNAENHQEAQRLLMVIPESPKSAELYKREKMGKKVRLLIGKDMMKKETALALGINPPALKAESAGNVSTAPNPKKKKV
jgi:Tfp pilus assembly protein PilF